MVPYSNQIREAFIFNIPLQLFLCRSFFYFSSLNFLQLFEHFLGFHPDLFIVFPSISLCINLLVVTLGIKNHIWNLSLSAGIEVLAVQVKCRNLTSIRPLYPSPFQILIVLNICLYSLSTTSDGIIIVASTFKCDFIKLMKIRIVYYMYLYFYTYFIFPFWNFNLSSVIISFLLRELLAIL